MRLSSMIDNIRLAGIDRPLVGAEIGVFRGEHSKFILSKLNMRKLYLIDPYVTTDPNFEGHMKTKIPGSKRIAEQHLSLWADRLEWLCMDSDDAFLRIDDPLDFVYIDGNHSYEYVLRDIVKYTTLVISGGWVGGHDYMMRSSPLVEVKKAVDECALAYGLDITLGEGQFPDWWFTKP